MNDKLQILISAGINNDESVGNINAALKALSKHPSLQKLDIKINVDESFIKSINKFIDSVKKLNVALDEQSRVMEETIEEHRKLDGSVEKVTQQILKSGEIINKTRIIHDENKKKLAEESAEYDKQSSSVEQLQKDLKNLNLTQEKVKKNKLGEVAGSSQSYSSEDGTQKLTANYDKDGQLRYYSASKDHQKLLKEENQLIEQMAQVREKAEINTRNFYNNWEKTQQEHITKNAELNRKEIQNEKQLESDREKQHYIALQQNKKRQQDYEKSIKEMQLKLASARNQYKDSSNSASGIDNLTNELSRITGIGNYKKAISDVNTKLKEINTTAKKSELQVKTLGQQFTSAAGKVAIWGGISSAIFLPIQGLQDAIRTVVEIDSQMTQLKRVMNDNTDFNSVLSDSINLANELGRSLTDVNNAKIEFGRMGYDAGQVNELARTVSLMQNVSDTTSSESVDTLVSAMTNFNIEASKSIEIVDALNEVDNSYAVTTQGLAISLNKAAATGATFGASMQEIIGHATAVTEATRESGSIVGNFLKTLYSRLTTMNKSEGTLNAVGVAMRDVTGETRNVNDILTDLAGNWDNLSKSQQEYTAKNLAGQWQIGRFLALMQGWDTAVSATETALNSQGSAMRENEKYMESLSARIEKMKTAWDSLSVAFGGVVLSDSIIIVTSGIATLLNSIASLTDSVGGLPIIFGVAYIGITALSTAFRLLIINISQTVAGFFGLSTATTTATVGFRGLGVAAKAAGISMKSMLISTGIGALLVGIGFAAEFLIGKFADASNSSDELTSSFDKLNSKQIELTNIQKLSAEYGELTSKAELTAEEKMRLANIESELANQHGVVMKSVTDQTNAVDVNTQAIISRTEALRDEIKAEQEKAQNEYRSNASDINSEIEKRKKSSEEAAEAYEKASEKQQEFLSNLANGVKMSNKNEQWSTNLPKLIGLDPNNEKNISNIEDLGEELAKAVQRAKDKFDNENNAFIKQVTVKEKALQNVFSSYVDAQENEGKKIKELSRTFSDLFASIQARSGNSETDSLKLFEDVFKTIQSSDVSNLEDAVALMEKLPGFTSLNSDEFAVLRTELAALNFNGVSAEAEELESTLSDTEDTILSLAESFKLLSNDSNLTSAEIESFAKSLSAAKDETTLLDTAQNELKTSNKLSAETIEKLNKQYGDFNKVVGLSTEELYKYIEGKKKETDSFIEAEITKTNNLIEETEKRIKAMGAEKTALIELYQAKVENGAIDELTAERIIGRNAENNTSLTNSATEKLLNQLTALKQRSGLLSTAQKELAETTANNKKSFEDKAKSAAKSEKAEKKAQDTTKETTEVLTELQKKLSDVEQAISKVQNQRYKLTKGSSAYQKSIQKENQLLEEQKKLLQEGIDNPSKLVSKKVETTVPTGSSTSSTSSVSSVSSSSNSNINNLLNEALGLQGKFTYKQVAGKYKGTYDQFVNGAISDCSQFVQEMFDEFLNIQLPRTAAQQAKQGMSVSKDNLQAGDLVFFNTTGKDNSHVGIYTGNGKFIQMGNSGLKESDLNNSYWAPKYQGAKRVVSSSDSAVTNSGGKTTTKVTNSSGVTTKVTTASQDEVNQARLKAEQDLMAVEKQIYQNKISFIEGYVQTSENRLSNLDNLIEKSQIQQSKQTGSSAEWRKEEMSQISYLTKQQEELHIQNTQLQKLVKEKQITSGEFDATIAENSAKWWRIQQEKEAKQYAVLTSRLDQYDESISSLGETLTFSSAKLSAMVEGSEAYKKELSAQIPLLQKQQEAQHAEAELIRKSIANDKLSADRKAELSARLQQLTTDWWNNQAAIKSTYQTLLSFTNEALTSLIDTMKTSLDSEDIFNLDEFNDSIDSIIAQLDMIDGKYENGVKFVDTTTQSRSDLADYASKVRDIANSVKSALNYTSDMSNINFSNMSALGNQIKSQINLVAQLKNQLADIDDQIRDTELAYQKQEAALEQQIKNTEKYYDVQIEKQQEILNNLDEQYEKEDRVKKLKEINDEIDKAKNDKRFSYITEAGEEILTYDKGRVEELEKQKDELVEQYEREDVKQAIQDEIDRLQKARDKEVEIQQEALEKTKQIHQQNLEAMKLYQSHLSSLYSQTVNDTQTKMDQYEEALRKGLEDGTLSADEGSKLLQLVVDGWQASSLQKWDIYISQVASKLAELQAMYANLASVAASMGSIGGNSSGSSSSGNSSSGSSSLQSAKDQAVSSTNSSAHGYINGIVSVDGNKISQEALDAIEYNTNWRANRKYHTGGRVGEQPWKANEYPAVLEVGEYVLTEEHMNKIKQSLMEPWTMFQNLYSGVKDTFSRFSSPTPQQPVQAGTSYNIEHMEVKANNPMELFNNMRTQIKSTER